MRKDYTKPVGMLHWGFAGLGIFLGKPSLWPAALLWSFIALAAVCLATLGTAWLTFPSWELSWGTLWQSLQAFGWTLAAFIACWVLIVPEIIMLGMEHLCSSLLKERGVKAVPMPFMRGLAASLSYTARTLPVRLLWLVAGFLGGLLLGPFGALIALVGVGHMAAADAAACVLAQLGKSGAQRTAFRKQYRSQFLAGGIGLAVLKLLLAATVVGILLWLPAIYAGAVDRVLSRLPTEPSPDVD